MASKVRKKRKYVKQDKSYWDKGIKKVRNSRKPISKKKAGKKAKRVVQLKLPFPKNGKKAA